ncbi:MAG: metallophosphoesterase family protein [Prolixibacteraceae bacterium]
MNERLFAIGDIHGCFDSFRELVECKIKFSKSDKLVLLGDYIDRGNQSKEVIDFILDLKNLNFDVITLKGNHEAMLLDALGNNLFLYHWFQNGGIHTLYSFRIRSLHQLDDRYVGFFKGLTLYYSLENFLFVHAGFNDTVENPFEDEFQMLWSRSEKYSNPVFKDKIIIHGHTPITENLCKRTVQQNNQVINIDTGCVYSGLPGYGKLTAIELYSGELFSV